MNLLHCGRFQLDLSRPHIMAIINVTPDSFSGDGVAGKGLAHIQAQAEAAILAGADILDLGGESSRPGATPVSETEELDRVIPAVESLVPLGLPVSVDTVKPAVMRGAIAAGAAMINDIMAFRAEGSLEAVTGTQVAVCVMHMLGEPRTMQQAPDYSDVVGEVADFLVERTTVLRRVGVSPQRICIDPGFGFGKTLQHNLNLLRELDRLCTLGYPVLAGLSRKSMLGMVTGRPMGERLVASVVAAVLAVQRGAAIVRVHDVAATRDALALWSAVRSVS